ncbi:MAG: TolC family protein [Alphaproteobacteria bacterium]|nr:TolC family protein [Alphaproteobacteria bacterium]
MSAALLLHPQVRAAEAELDAAEAWLQRLRAPLYNPSLSASTSVDGRRASLSLSQPLSLSGEGVAMRHAASAQVAAAKASLRRSKLVAAADVRLAYVDAVVALGLTQVAVDGVELAKRLRQAVALQHEEGEVSQLDLRLAHLTEVQAATRLLEAKETEALALRALSSRVGSPVARAALPSDPLRAAPTPQAVNYQRSDLEAARLRVEQAEAEWRKQRAAGLPAVSLGASAQVEDSELFVGPSLSLTVPVFDRNQGPRAGAEAQIAVAGAEETALTAQAASERETAQERVDVVTALSAQLVSDPLSEARETLEAVEVGYRAGQLDLPDTVLLQRQVLDGEAACWGLLRQIAAARLDLMLATEDPALLGGAR